VTRLLLLGHCFRDRDEDVDGQQPHTVLVVRREVLEKRNHLVDDNRGWHGLDELGEVVRGLSSDHGGVVVHELAVVLSERLLRGGCGAGVGGLVKTSRGDFWCEPIRLWQAHYEGYEGILDLLLRQLLANLVEGLDSLDTLGHCCCAWCRTTYLLPHERLLYRRKVFQGWEKHMRVLWASDIFDKFAQLLAQRREYLILVLDRLCSTC
jgi:hypothetical protein